MYYFIAAEREFSGSKNLGTLSVYLVYTSVHRFGRSCLTQYLAISHGFEPFPQLKYQIGQLAKPSFFSQIHEMSLKHAVHPTDKMVKKPNLFVKNLTHGFQTARF
jgi:hypothetical protein